jgi:surface-anchored protein
MDVDIDYSGGAGGVLSLDFKTYSPMSAGTTANSDDYSTVGNPILVPIANTYVVPASATWSCLGASGSTVYRLKQAQDTTQVWLGYNTLDVPASTFASNQVTLKLIGLQSAPVGGRFVAYSTNSFGTPTFHLNSTAGACAKNTFVISRNVHNHLWWAFSAPGTYVVRFEATGTLTGGLGGGAKTSGVVDYTFNVQ